MERTILGFVADTKVEIEHYTARASVSVGEAHFVLATHGVNLQICAVRQLAGLVPHPHQPGLRCFTDEEIKREVEKSPADAQVLLDVLVAKIRE